MPIVRRDGKYGDLYVHVNIEIPVNISEAQKEIMKEFASLSEEGNNPESEGFLGKVKEFLNKTL